MADEPGHGVRELDAGHLFAPSTTRIALRRGAFLRGFIYEFIRLFAPALDRDGGCGAVGSSAKTKTLAGKGSANVPLPQHPSRPRRDRDGAGAGTAIRCRQFR
jgi:hypothetical protein